MKKVNGLLLTKKGKRSQRGVTTLMVIAFMGIFLLIMGSITSLALEDAKYGRALYGREQAFDVAEAGLEYYRSFLSYYPNNLTNGTGLPGPYTYTVTDPETGAAIGNASISVVSNSQCGVIQSIDITSTGTSNQDPGFPRKLFARYMQPSVAGYSYLLNGNVWAGSTRNITGPYFSNGGIRMDGTNNSTVSSARSTWDCNSNYGCSPEQRAAPGVVGTGTGSALWQYPVASVNFSGINASLASLQSTAQTEGGLYFPPASGAQNQRGYHLVFNSSGTVTVYQVTATYSVPSYSNDVNDLSRYSGSRFTGWTLNEYSIIKSQTLLGTYTIPAPCSLIFVQDRAWIEGVVEGKVTVVAANPSQGVAQTVPVSAYLSNNITNDTNTGTSGLTVIAQDDVLIPLNSPNNMEIHGIFVAQGGLYGRNFYINDNADYGSYSVGYATSTWNSDVLPNQLTTEGSVVSNLQTGTSWISGTATVSGYQTRIDSYDELQATNPPPFTPAYSSGYQFVLWKEE